MEKFVSVTIWSCENDMDPWTSVFTTREKAEAFKDQSEQIIEDKGLPLVATIDSGEIDDISYLDWLKEENERL